MNLFCCFCCCFIFEQKKYHFIEFRNLVSFLLYNIKSQHFGVKKLFVLKSYEMKNSMQDGENFNIQEDFYFYKNSPSVCNH